MSMENSGSVFGGSDAEVSAMAQGGSLSLSPKLVEKRDIDGDDELETVRELEPLVVTRLGGTLPFDTDSVQLQCGGTAVSGNSDKNTRLVMEAVITDTQRKKLWKMREHPDNIKLVSNGYTGRAPFDELKWDRIEDANGAVTPDGVIDEPLYKIQLQSKESF